MWWEATKVKIGFIIKRLEKTTFISQHQVKKLYGLHQLE